MAEAPPAAPHPLVPIPVPIPAPHRGSHPIPHSSSEVSRGPRPGAVAALGPPAGRWPKKGGLAAGPHRCPKQRKCLKPCTASAHAQPAWAQTLRGDFGLIARAAPLRGRRWLRGEEMKMKPAELLQNDSHRLFAASAGKADFSSRLPNLLTGRGGKAVNVHKSYLGTDFSSGLQKEVSGHKEKSWC